MANHETKLDDTRAPSFQNNELSASDGRDDSAALMQFGYKPELERRFGLWSMIGLSCTIMVTWEGWLTIFGVSLLDGGPAGSVYGFLFCWAGYACVVASLAELASMIPTAGGHYHWVYELAPKRWRKFAAWITGKLKKDSSVYSDLCWLTSHRKGWQIVCAWQADLAAIFYLCGTIIQGLIVLNYPNYDFKRWHGTLLLWCSIIFAIAFNTILARFLRAVEVTILVVHILGFVVVLVPLIYYGPHASAHDVFVEYLAIGGYSPGLSWFVGLISTVFAFLGEFLCCSMARDVSADL